MSDPNVVAELDAELALIGQPPYSVPIHRLAQRARDEIVALQNLLGAAGHALRSYQYHNASPDLAEEIANEIERALKGKRGD